MAAHRADTTAAAPPVARRIGRGGVDEARAVDEMAHAPSVRPLSLPLRLIRARRAAVGRSLGRAPIWAAYRPFIPTGLKDYAFFQGEVKNNAKVSLSFVKKAFLTWVNGIPESFRGRVNDFSPLLLRGRIRRGNRYQ